MRSAWNTRVAGCLWRSRRRAPRGDALDQSGELRRCARTAAIWRSATMARAMRGAMRSSPNSRKMRISSASDAPLTTSAALTPFARAHAHVERPVVHEAEAALGVVELRRGDAEIEQNAVEFEAGLAPGRRRRASAEKGARKIATRGSPAKRALASATATESRSRHSNRPSAMSFSKIAPACPPRPKVASR